jgi:hypothetical protein
MRSRIGSTRPALSVALTILVAACTPADDTTAGGEAAQPGTAQAQAADTLKEPGQTPPEPTAEVAAVEALAMARRLAEYGERTQSPMALVTSAQILINTPTQPLEGEPEAQVDAAPEGQQAGAKTDTMGTRLDPLQLLSQAESMAGDNEHVRALVAQLRGRAQSATRGATGGPRSGFYRVNALSTNTHTVSFVAQEQAIVCIDGDDDTDLDLYVYDANGNHIGDSEGPYDFECVRWVPRWTGAFYIRVRNLGYVYNVYEFATN